MKKEAKNLTFFIVIINHEIYSDQEVIEYITRVRHSKKASLCESQVHRIAEELSMKSSLRNSELLACGKNLLH